MIGIILLTLGALTTSLPADNCQPLLWEINPSFNFTNDELDGVAKMGLFLPSISKKNYTLSNITGTVHYDNRNQNVIKNGSNIIVNGSILNFNFSFAAVDSSKKGYSGKSTAYLAGAIVNYVKVPTQKNGTAGFMIQNATFSVTSQAVPSGVYEPPINDTSAKTEFESMIKINLTQEVKDYYDKNINLLLNDKTIAIPNPYPSPVYNYTYLSGNSSLTIPINTAVEYQWVSQGAGYIIGINGSTANSSRCTQFIAANQSNSSSFITI